MVNNLLSANKALFKNICSDIQELDILKLREIFEILGCCWEEWRCDYITFLKKLDKEFGTWASTFYFYYTLRDYMYEDKGTYSYAFEREFLTSDICQIVEPGEYYDLDILKTYGAKLATFLACPILEDHFNNVRIKTDERDFITDYDKEHEEKIKALIELAVDNDLEMCDEESEYTKLVFLNEKQSDILNVEELEKKSNKLISLFENCCVAEVLIKELKILFKKIQEEPIVIDMHVCNNSETSAYAPNTIYFFDKQKHPAIEINRLKDIIDSSRSDNIEILNINTFNEHIVNYIRYLVYKGEAILQHNEFKYYDENNECFYINILKNGKFNPDFPKGYFDVTLKMLLEINSNNT